MTNAKLIGTCESCGGPTVETAGHRDGCRTAELGHTKDEDCTLDESGGGCVVCSVAHGDPCRGCGARAFHRDGCVVLLEDEEGVDDGDELAGDPEPIVLDRHWWDEVVRGGRNVHAVYRTACSQERSNEEARRFVAAALFDRCGLDVFELLEVEDDRGTVQIPEALAIEVR
jgi:hypothetical protein